MASQNLFLGIYYNLSIWYKLTGATQFGAYISLGGAFITILLNYWLIPIIGYVGSAWATLACYFSMTLVSYALGQQKYPVNYQLGKIMGYPLLALGLYYISTTELLMEIQTNKIFINAVILLCFVGFIVLFERKALIKNQVN